MGTRADFYVGRGEKAEWLGSVAYDGHPENFEEILGAKTEAAFRAAIEKEFAGREDATRPADGWPWPWPDSHLTDYSYAFDGGQVFHTEHVRKEDPCPNCKHGKGKAWVLPDAPRDEDGYVLKHLGVADFPSMKDRTNVAAPGSSRSGVMVFGVRR